MDDIYKIVKKAVEIASSKETLEEVGKAMVERIKVRTRLGKGVMTPEAKPHPLPKLKPTTIKERKRLKKEGSLTGKGATPSKSGLNRTGQMLDSMTYKAKQDNLTIQLDALGEYKAKEVIDIDKNYTFMNLSEPEIKAAGDIIEKEIKKKIK